MGKKAELLRDYREKLFPIVDEIPHNSFRNLSPNEFHAQRTETVFPPIERGGNRFSLNDPIHSAETGIFSSKVELAARNDKKFMKTLD